MNERHIPQRMCVVCRERKAKQELMRVVLYKDGIINFDESGKEQGRGAYVCKTEGCIAKLTKQRGFNRSFKREVGQEVYREIADRASSEKRTANSGGLS